MDDLERDYRRAPRRRHVRWMVAALVLLGGMSGCGGAARSGPTASATATSTIPPAPQPAPPAACAAPGVQPVSSLPIYTGGSSKDQVSITFDSDHGSVGNAAAYLDTLENRHVRASFFLTGEFARDNPAVVQRIVADGDDVGNHTLDHPDLVAPPRTDGYICDELAQAERLISTAGGRSPRPYFRPPYGDHNDQVRTLAAQLGYRTILWSIDPRDWDAATSTQEILDRVLNSPNLKPGAIILMHVNSPNEQYALDGVIAGLQRHGYAIVPLSALLA